MKWDDMKSGLAKAFAYDDGREDITEDDIALLDEAAGWVVRRNLVAPAVLVLESSVPLNFLGSSLMTFFRPIVGVAFSTVKWERFESLLEKRCCLRLLTERIELREAAGEAERRSGKPGESAKKPPRPESP
jgi:hypothetical protein